MLFALGLCLLVASAAQARIRNTDIYCIQDVGRAGCDSVAVGDTVYVGLLNPVVVTGIRLSTTGGNGFVIQDQRGIDGSTAPYSGIFVFTGSFSFPSLYGLEVGDIVVVKGRVLEFGSAGVTLTEIDRFSSSVPESLAIIGHTNILPPPQVVSTEDLGPLDAATAEKWESVLIRSTGLIQNGSPTTFNEIAVYDSTKTPIDTMIVDDRLFSITWPPAGTRYGHIQGVFTQEFGTYRMWPRNFADINTTFPFPQNLSQGYPIDTDKVRLVFQLPVDPASVPTATYTMGNFEAVTGAVLEADGVSVTLTTSPAMAAGVANSITVSGVTTVNGGVMAAPQTRSFLGGITPITQVQQMKSASNDSSAYAGQRCTIRGIITGSNHPDDFGTIAFIEQSSGGPFSGVALFGMPATVLRGQDVTVSGLISEFNRKTELTSVQYVNVNGSLLPDPPVSVISPSEICVRDSADTPVDCAALATAEQWEGVLVKVVGGTVTATSVPRTEWFLSVGPDTCMFDDNSLVTFDYDAHTGDLMDAQGVCDWLFNTYRVQPRVNSDITNFVTAVGEGGGSGRLALAVTPNPMPGAGRVSFTLPDAGDVTLRVYDTNGALVATLAHAAAFPAGTHSLSWNGRTGHGTVAPAGVYLYRLTTAAGETTHRVVLGR
jgi:hypothetical protein